jgi:hypothetical protein
MKLGSLEYIVSSEEGMIKINWKKMPPDNIVLLDILKDWICDLEGIYEVKHKEVFNKGESK